MRETIWLGEGDSVSVVRYKLEQAQSRRIALIIPPGSPLLESDMSLAMIRRFAETLALDLVLVTDDPVVAERARWAGLRTAWTQDGVQRLPSERAKNWLYSRLGIKPGAVSARLSQLSGLRTWRPPEVDMHALQTSALLVGLGLTVIALVVVLFFMPSAEVLLDPQGEPGSTTVDVLADTALGGVNYELRQVPARLAEIEVIGQEIGQTTGKQSTPDKNAEGDVVFANKTTEEVIIPKGTVVRTSEGEPIRFYTVLDAKVPGSYGATVRVPVVALDAGLRGNVDSFMIRAVEGEPGLKVDVLNDRPTKEGSEKRTGVVAIQDNDRLRASLMQRLQEEAYDALVKSLNPGEWVPPDSLEVAITEETFDKKVDEPADMLSLTMEVRVTGVAVNGQAVREMITQVLETSSGKGWIVNEATLQVQQPVGTVTVEGQVVHFQATGDALLVPAIDLGAISRQIAGQSPERAGELLAAAYDLRQPPEIRVSPSWWQRLPWLPARIKVQLSGEL